MATEFRLPELHESIETGTVVDVLVSVGDRIEEDQPVLEIETDKAVVEVPSTVSGVVKEIHVQANAEVKTGALLLTLESGSGSVGDEKEDTQDMKEKSNAEAASTQETPPEKTPEKRAEVTGDVQKEVDSGPEKTHSSAASAAPEPLQGPLIPAAPSVRRFARELGVDIAVVEGTGPGERISMDDVKAFVKRHHEAGEQAPPVSKGGEFVPQPVELPDFTQWGDVEREKMSGVRKKTMHHLSRAWATIPHVTQFDKADITELESFRKRHAKRVEAAGAKLTVTAILLKVVAAALKAFPKFNASVDPASEEVIYKKYYNVGVAVDTPNGLLVPVVRDVDGKNLVELSLELQELAGKARDRKLGIDGMQGGTFTLSNLGGIGGTAFTPIVNAPEVAILGVARSRVEPVFIDGEFQPRTMLPLAVSYDHRLIDGADGARFLRWIVSAIEDPFLIALEG